jgi:uncharacterized protein (TIGR03086 family)
VIDQSSPAAFHRAVAGRFTELVRGTTDWAAPAPVDGWTARDVVRHLVEWFPGFLEPRSGLTLPQGPSVDDDPVAAWTTRADAVQALLDDPEVAERQLSDQHLGTMPVGEAVSRFYTGDVFMHSWDLARATGQDETLDADLCAAMYEGMVPIEELMRSTGQYGPRVEVPADADPQTRLLGFIGRDPSPAA